MSMAVDKAGLIARTVSLYLPSKAVNPESNRTSDKQAKQVAMDDAAEETTASEQTDGKQAKQRVEAKDQSKRLDALAEKFGYNIRTTRMEFTKDEATGRVIITVRDRKTNEVIREIPPEEMQAVAKTLKELADESQLKGNIVETVT